MGLDILNYICRIRESCIRQQLEHCEGFGGLVAIGTLEDMVRGRHFFPSVENAISYLECQFRIYFFNDSDHRVCMSVSKALRPPPASSVPPVGGLKYARTLQPTSPAPAFRGPAQTTIAISDGWSRGFDVIPFFVGARCESAGTSAFVALHGLFAHSWRTTSSGCLKSHTVRPLSSWVH